MKSVNVKTRSKKGFTIIEVVLVLAIAGLIFLMVLIALPALQRSQRDARRREDVSRLAAALENYKVGNRGKIPSDSNCIGSAENLNPSNPSGTNTCKFIARYLNDSSSTTNEFRDPSGSAYKVYIRTCTADSCLNSTDIGIIRVNKKAKCNGESVEVTPNGNEYAISLKLEGAGTICIDNQ